MKTLDQRTVNLIMCCKGRGRGKDKKERIRNYMAKECNCPPEIYTDSVIDRLLITALSDVVATSAEGAQEIMQKMMFCDDWRCMYDHEPTFVEMIPEAFELMKVRQWRGTEQDSEYLYGFTVDNLKNAEDILA